MHILKSYTLLRTRTFVCWARTAVRLKTLMSHAAVMHVDEPCCVLTRPLDLSILCSHHKKRLLENGTLYNPLVACCFSSVGTAEVGPFQTDCCSS